MAELVLELQNNAGLSVVQLRLAGSLQVGANATRFSGVSRQCPMVPDVILQNKGKSICGKYIYVQLSFSSKKHARKLSMLTKIRIPCHVYTYWVLNVVVNLDKI